MNRQDGGKLFSVPSSYKELLLTSWEGTKGVSGPATGRIALTGRKHSRVFCLLWAEASLATASG